jgi:hypothetical protein
MLKLEMLPVRTRLPYEAWVLAALVAVYSVLSSLVGHVHEASDHILAGVAQIR